MRTTAYHSRLNEMMERFHRQLKAAIKNHETKWWTGVAYNPPKDAWRQGYIGAQSNISGISLGKPIKLPGQFLNDKPNRKKDDHEYFKTLRQAIERLRP